MKTTKSKKTKLKPVTRVGSGTLVRRLVQIKPYAVSECLTGSRWCVMGLCNDGTMWTYDNGRWFQYPSVPQP